ncbi:hypothetical protein [Paenibacillus lautus]|uniref:hypothetical protein n=1 Tax=Paenibacillus lautus TaxID=1401 RepID=UPI002DB76B3B|nr:hypothetical protein [Paenibacillus lautus]MEC0254150.1 hypothetical protein [Paenibacillus lautus]
MNIPPVHQRRGRNRCWRSEAFANKSGKPPLGKFQFSGFNSDRKNDPAPERP